MARDHTDPEATALSIGSAVVDWSGALRGVWGRALNRFHFQFCCSDLKRMTPVLMKSRFRLRQSGTYHFL
jgi:hypothetical protein